MAGPRLIVDPPTFTPLSFGLLSVVNMPPAADAHWQNGITFEATCPIGGTTYDECIAVTGIGAPPPSATKTNNVDKVFRGATPFTVYAEFDCAPVGNADAVERTRDALARVEPWQVERAFWTGVAGDQEVVWPHLAADGDQLDPQGTVLQTNAVVVTGSGATLSVTEGLGLLEGALADCYGGIGIIHVPQRALPALDGYGLIRQNGSVLRTLNGNRVAVGAGYPGTSPSGAAPAAGTSWLYATGSVVAYRGDIKTFRPNQSIDRSVNTIMMIAERTYVLAWDCCHFAVLVDTSLPG